MANKGKRKTTRPVWVQELEDDDAGAHLVTPPAQETQRINTQPFLLKNPGTKPTENLDPVSTGNAEARPSQKLTVQPQAPSTQSSVATKTLSQIRTSVAPPRPSTAPKAPIVPEVVPPTRMASLPPDERVLNSSGRLGTPSDISQILERVEAESQRVRGERRRSDHAVEFETGDIALPPAAALPQVFSSEMLPGLSIEPGILKPNEKPEAIRWAEPPVLVPPQDPAADMVREFFTSLPPGMQEEDFLEEVSIDDVREEPWRSDQRRFGKRVTAVVMTAGFAVLIFIWTYFNIIMPVPVKLGTPEPVVLPDVAVASPPSQKPVETKTAMQPPAQVEVPPPVQAEPTQAAEVPPPQPDVVAPTQPAAQPMVENQEVFATKLAEARRLSQQGKTVKAVKAYEAAVALMPEHSVALAEFAFLQLNRGMNKEAASLAERALRTDKTDSRAWVVLGAALEALGDKKSARIAYKSCAELPTGAFVMECRRLVR